jgi:membrane associated rhomboid family serine protease
MIWFLPVGEQETARHVPYVTWTLVVLNILVFAAMLLGPERFDHYVVAWGLTPSDWHWWQFVTGSFVHGGWLHIIFNMLFLLVFGDNVEDVLGPLPFLALYLIGGFAGDLSFVANNAAMGIPSVGASGCIAAVMGAYAVMFWNRAVDLQIILLVFPVKKLAIPALLLCLFYLGFDLYLTARHGGALEGHGGTNYVSHGVGFMVGLITGGYAMASGAVVRFRTYDDGHAWFGYLPSDLPRPKPKPLPRLRVR